MNENERRKMFNLCDTLQGEINRICVTQDPNEILDMKNYAIININQLCAMRLIDLLGEKNG